MHKLRHFQFIVIWNDPSTSPTKDNFLPVKMNAPVYVIKVKRNSLNNRYLPWDIIETRGVLILDDDIRNLTPPMLEWGFRLVVKSNNAAKKLLALCLQVLARK